MEEELRQKQDQVECPAFFEPVGMIETGVQGAKDGETEESYT
jgi:hypothetical protein